MKLEWADGESDYGLEEAAFYEGPPAPAPPPRKHVSFSLRLDLVSSIPTLVLSRRQWNFTTPKASQTRIEGVKQETSQSVYETELRLSPSVIREAVIIIVFYRHKKKRCPPSGAVNMDVTD